MDIVDKKFHFIAVGGVGMSALAIYAAQRGARVSGSDIIESKYTKVAEKYGVKVSVGHDAGLIEKDMIVVASSAIKSSNPEIIRAEELGLKIHHRSDILKMISDEFSDSEDSFFLGFSGTHGKTTTSGLCSYLLKKAGLHPSYVVGGIIPEFAENGRFDGDRYFSAELDESDGTIEKYSTDIAVINNMEEDHLDHYVNGFTDIAATFNEYLSNKPSQKVLINVDDQGNRNFMNMYPSYNFISFGLDNADYTAKNIVKSGFTSEFDIFYKNEFLNKIKISVPGKHNIYNSLAVYAALNEAGTDMSKIIPHYETFTGMGRRFQKVCDIEGISVYDDYAHHPSEIKTTLAAIKEGKCDGRSVAVFQPHRYSRLKGLWNDFKTAFNDADLVFVTDVFSAGEDEEEGINSENFTKELKNAVYIPGSIPDCAEQILPLLKKGDTVVTLGAGSITKLGGLIKENLNKVCSVD